MLQQQLALAVGERDQAERDPVAVGDLGIEGVARGRLGDPLLVRLEHVTGRGVLDVVLGRGLADGVAHVAQRQRQHLIAQRLIDRGQPVDAEQTDHRAERGAVDQEREQHEAGRQDRDEALDLGVDGAVLGDRERERERDRAAQAAPEDHELVAVADALGEPRRAQERQEAEQHDRARQQRAERHDADQQEVVELHADHQARHQDRRQDEHQRARPEPQLRPDVLQEGAIVRVEAVAAERAHHQPRGDHGDHARDIEVALGQDVDDVGQRQRQGHLGEARVPQPRHHHHERATADEADQRAAEERVEERAHGFAEGGLAADASGSRAAR